MTTSTAYFLYQSGVFLRGFKLNFTTLRAFFFKLYFTFQLKLNITLYSVHFRPIEKRYSALIVLTFHYQKPQDRSFCSSWSTVNIHFRVFKNFDFNSILFISIWRIFKGFQANFYNSQNLLNLYHC